VPVTTPRLRLAIAFGASLLLAAAAVAWLAPPLDARLLDAQFAFNREHFPQALARDVVVVGIDDAFVDSVAEPLALSHRYLAQFLDSASGAGAAVIAVDLVLPDKRFDTLVSTTNPGIDLHRTLLAGLMQAGQRSTLVVAKVWDHQRRHYFEPQIDYAAVLGPQGMASALVCADADLRVRHYPDCQPDGTPVTLASAVAAALGRQQQWSGLINYQIGPPISYIPLQDVLAMAHAGDRAGLAARFAGKAVLLGSVQADIDIIETPVALAAWLPGSARVPGVLVHAQTVRSMLNQGLVATLTPIISSALVLGMLAFWWRAAIRSKLLLLCLVSALVIVASNVLLRQGVWIAPAAMLLAAWSMALGRSAWQAWQHYRDKQRLGRTFSGYVSPEVLKQIMAGAIDARNAGSKLPVCVLFSDIRGFTTLSEHMPAEQVVDLLNRYFARMTAVVHRHGGTVDKFIGDGMMAFFGAPNRLDAPEQAALAAARAMLGELQALNAELRAEGQAALGIGIGLHTGLAVIGHIGSAERHEYTAIGDTVNIAARLESLCKELGYPIVCSEAVARSLGYPAALAALGDQPLKGRAAMSVYGAGKAVQGL
jgi:adenylate cyclase